jgi:methionine-rich copper-binding protein CopC
MKIFILFLLSLALTLFAPITLAHTGLSSSLPENNQVLDSSPEQLEMVFSGPVLMARVELRDPSGGRIDLDISGYTETAESFSVDLPDDFPAGKYTARWTVLGEDGHTMAGALSFTIQGD